MHQIESQFEFSTERDGDGEYSDDLEGEYSEDSSEERSEESRDKVTFKGLKYDVRKDPYWEDLKPELQKKYLYSQRHKNPDLWEGGIIPRAVRTSNFDYKTIS